MRNAIQFFQVLGAILIHKVWIKPVKDDPRYVQGLEYSLSSTTPMLRTLPSTMRPKKVISATMTVVPEGWNPKAPAFVIESWKKWLINRKYLSCYQSFRFDGRKESVRLPMRNTTLRMRQKLYGLQRYFPAVRAAS